ncbi:MAG: hypothetical protein D6808_01745, partial [Candidatus Dadabacteria bacterium]
MVASFIGGYCYAQAPDIDGDGFSDFVGVEINKKSSARHQWSYLPQGPSVSNIDTALQPLGKGSDIPIAGRFESAGKTNYGVVKLVSSKKLEWKIRLSDGSTVAYQFGSKSDHIMVGDFDGDGFDDLMVRTKKGLFRMMKTGLGGSGTGTFSRMIGKRKEKFWYSDVDGDGDDDICRMARKRKKRGKVFNICYDFMSGAQVLPSESIAKSRAGKAKSSPIPVGGGVLAYPKKSGKQTVVTFRTLAGARIATIGYPAQNSLAVSSDGELAMRIPQGVMVYNVFSGEISIKPAPSGSDLVDEYSVESFAKRGSGVSCSSVVGWGAGAVWKPVSDSDGNLVVLDAFGTNSSKIQIVNQNGKVLETGRFVGKTNGGRPTFRFSKRGSGYGKNLTVVFITGSKNVC